MSTLEDVFYDFTAVELDLILNKKKLGERTPFPIKISYFEQNEYSYISSFEETKEEPETTFKNKPNNKKTLFLNILKKKYYIRPNQECPICLEPILTKTTAFLTPCGHGFHKACFHQAFEANWLTKQAGISCPLCRHSDVSYYCVEKYCCWNPTANNIDLLENFWYSKDLMLATPCFNSSHYAGLKDNCKYCKKYRVITPLSKGF